ncbi:methyl-accepting chemotaxis protein [bacterium]|nr:methyl-accepting chemotaxis protein [bacterium]
MAEKSFRRKQYIVKKGFQSRLITIILLLVLIVANITGGLIYGVLRTDVSRGWLVNTFGLSDADDMLLPAVLVAEIISFLIVGVISLFVSHRMAGPIYRFEKVTEGMSQGDFTIHVKLRDKDEFKDLADSFNNMINKLTEHMDELKDSSQDYIKDVQQYLDKQKNIPEDVKKQIEGSLHTFKEKVDFFKTKYKDDENDN